ncbi:MAG: class I SAM-dependent methyltransferase [Flavobacteriales bacterium]|nr:class I SAM-dependent methyltransferase [Flavobacteriales bacterium]
MMLKNHPLSEELVALGIIDPSAVVEYFPRVRDRADVKALRCEKSGVIFLDRVDHVGSSYYSEQDGLHYWSSEDRAQGLALTREDDQRRAAALRSLVKGKAVADVGTGLGGILDLLKDDGRELHAVEPQRHARNMLMDLGYKAHASSKDLADAGVQLDVITLFHVFEHLVEPLRELREIHRALAPGGTVIIEVPHANDALLALYDLASFKAFTLWSEHLVLHTKASLERYLGAAGFVDIQVTGVQRYPLANHLYWLKEGKPGGQNIWPELRDAEVERAYAAMLDRSDYADTLWAIARK